MTTSTTSTTSTTPTAPTASDPPVLSESDLHGWLAVGRAGSCNGHAVARACEAFGGVRGLFAADPRALAGLGFSRAAVAGLRRVDWDEVRRDRDSLERIGASIVPIGTGGYPARLAAIASPPPVLYCRGDPQILARPQVAVVGARAATRGGRERARILARELAACGLVVTSGLARGIDAAAHRGALDVGAASIAVAATGPDRIYPRSNAGLARELLEAGALVTERAPGTPPLPSNFPRRNRLISGLGLGVLVVEASLRSGSLITARFAADEGREVFAVPGSVDNPLARGCHALIRDGAKLVESVVDVLDEIAPLVRPPAPPAPTVRLRPPAPDGGPAAPMPAAPDMAASRAWPVAPGGGAAEPMPAAPDMAASRAQPITPDGGPAGAGGRIGARERSVLDAMGHDPVALDQLVERTGWTADRLASILLTLELDGWIEALPGGRYMRAGARRR